MNNKVITIDPDILGGTPVFTGTRVPVDSLMQHIKAGDSLEDFLADFPTVSKQQALTFLDMAEEALFERYAHSA